MTEKEMTEKESQTIIELRTQNIKRLKAVSVDADGKPVVVIGGNNANGKTSLLDSIEYAIRGKSAMPGDVVREGAIRGEIALRTQDWDIQRRVTVDGKQSLVLKYKGEVISKQPQKVLDALYHSIAFDPEMFAKLDKKKQSETLRDLVGLDLSEVDEAHDRSFADRTEVKRELKRAEANLGKVTCYSGVPSEEVLVADLMEELKAAREANTEFEKAKRDVEQQRHRKLQIENDLKRLQDELGAVNAEISSNEEKFGKLSLIPEDEILSRMEGAEQINQKVRANKEYNEAEEEVNALREKVERLDTRIDDLRNDRARQISACEMPVEGLGFNEAGEVTYQDVVLAECSAAERLRVAVAIGCAANPKMPVMLIRDGSLLDKNSRKMVYDMASEHGAQVWIEVVTEDEPGAIIIEDGMVKA